MNPHIEGGSAGQGNASNQNYRRPHLSSETQERMLPLFPLFDPLEGFPQPELNLLHQGPNNINGATTDVPLHETTNVVAPESNISSPSFHAGTPPSTLDLSLNVGFSRDAAISSAVPSSNIARSVHGSNSNPVNIPRKRGLPDHASGEFHQGESSNTGQGTGEVKRLATDSQVRANNNVNPSPLSLSLMQQPHQFLRGGHFNLNNPPTPFPPPNTPSNGMTNTDERRGYHAPIPSQATFPFNGASSSQSQMSPLQPSHSIQPLSFLNSSFMSSSVPNANNLTLWNAPRSVSSPCPHARPDIPFHEHRNDMLGPGVTSTYPPNRSYVDSDPRVLSLGLPRQFEPSEPEPLQLLPGNVGNGGRISNAGPSTYHLLSDHSALAWFLPQDPRGMNHFAAASSSGTQNHHMPIPLFPSLEALRGFPSQFRSLLHSLRNGRSLKIEIEHPGIFGNSQPFTGLSLETIMQYMEREIFLVVDGDDSEETKERCPVCLEEFCKGEDIGKLHSCLHKFHFDCIKEWLMQRNLCPVCRRTALERRNDPSPVHTSE